MQRLTFQQKVEAMMRRSGRSFWDCCRDLGRKGGQAAAAKRRRSAVERARIEAERRKQEAMGLV